MHYCWVDDPLSLILSQQTPHFFSKAEVAVAVGADRCAKHKGKPGDIGRYYHPSAFNRTKLANKSKPELRLGSKIYI